MARAKKKAVEDQKQGSVHKDTISPVKTRSRKSNSSAGNNGSELNTEHTCMSSYFKQKKDSYTNNSVTNSRKRQNEPLNESFASKIKQLRLSVNVSNTESEDEFENGSTKSETLGKKSDCGKLSRKRKKAAKYQVNRDSDGVGQTVHADSAKEKPSKAKNNKAVIRRTRKPNVIKKEEVNEVDNEKDLEKNNSESCVKIEGDRHEHSDLTVKTRKSKKQVAPNQAPGKGEKTKVSTKRKSKVEAGSACDTLGPKHPRKKTEDRSKQQKNKPKPGRGKCEKESSNSKASFGKKGKYSNSNVTEHFSQEQLRVRKTDEQKLVIPELNGDDEDESDDDFINIDEEPKADVSEKSQDFLKQHVRSSTKNIGDSTVATSGTGANGDDKSGKAGVRDSCKQSPHEHTVLGEDSNNSQPVGGITKHFDQNDAMAVLLHMEGQRVVPSTSPDQQAGTSGLNSRSSEVDSLSDSESDDDWQDVTDYQRNSPKKSQLPTGSVEITLEAPVAYRKKKKREFDLQDYFRRQINKFKREVAMDIHKVHLLCLVARCRYLNELCSQEIVLAQSMSVTMVTKQLKLSTAKLLTVNHVSAALNWIFENKQHLNECFSASLDGMSSQLRCVLICVILLRQAGLLTRLVMSLQAVPFKDTITKGKIASKGKQPKSSEKSKAKKANSSSTSKTKNDPRTVHSKLSSTESAKNDKKSKHSNKTKKNHDITKAGDEANSTKASDEAEGSGLKALKRRHSSGRSCSKLNKSVYKETDGNDDDESDDDFVPEDFVGGDGDAKKVAMKIEVKDKKRNSAAKFEASDTSMSRETSDSDFEEDSILIRSQALKKVPGKVKNTRILSTDEEHVTTEQKTTKHSPDCNYWIEVHMENLEKWICIDGASLQIVKPAHIESKITQPICYVVGITQECDIKDITARYASQWLTETRKVRTEPTWWEETLRAYKSTDLVRDEAEDKDLASCLQQQPLPTSIGAFKSHPLYALRRHLLKFEALYPDTAIPVGYIRGEPVYARECVHTLHSRENWLKEGRNVKLGEEAYKFVKSRPKWNRPKDDPEAKDLELFGLWQTELYIPPPVQNGKVPRNAHGNVEMYLPSMLPAGAAHLKIPGLNKVAKKLNMDCAPAMVGWDVHCGFSHPMMDGWIVCEEHKDILLAAWDEEQEIIKEKEAQKREKRVYDNWRKLIRGLLIKERLKKRFDLEERSIPEVGDDGKDAVPSTQSSKSPKTPKSGSTTPSASNKLNRKAAAKTKTKESKTSEKARDKEFSWPQNRMKKGKQLLCEVEQL